MRYIESEYFVRNPHTGAQVPAAVALAEYLENSDIALLNTHPLCDYYGQLYSRASTNLELALCLPGAKGRQIALGRAAALFSGLAEDSASGGLRERAGIYLDFMPIFETRSKKEPHTPQEIRQLYGRLATRLALRDYKDEFLNYELFLLAVGARVGNPDYLVQPASLREDMASHRDRNYNHDSYIVRDNYSVKVPIQVKGGRHKQERKYMPDIHTLRMRHVMARAAVWAYGSDTFAIVRRSSKGHHYDLPRDRLPQFLAFTGKLLYADSGKSRLKARDARYLQLLEQEVCGQIDYFYECQVGRA